MDNVSMLRLAVTLTFWALAVGLLAGLPAIVGEKGNRRKRDKYGLKFSDCGSDPDRPLRFFDVRASPVPIISPGTVHVSFKGNITRNLPKKISIDLGLVKYLVGIPFPLPCMDNNLGSCLYENICDKLQKYSVMGCPRALRHYGLQCSCPFKAGEFSVRNLPLNIPKVGGFWRSFIRGGYGLTLRVLDGSSNELGCVSVSFTIKKRYKGWLFKI